MLLEGRTVHVSGDSGGLTEGLVAHGAEVVGPEGPVDIVVHVVAGALDTSALAETTPEEWAERCDWVITTAIEATQAAHRRMLGRGGRIVFVTPSFGLTGAAGLVPLATATEAIRSMAKSAARQWGPEGITVSCVAHRRAGPQVAVSSLGPPSAEDLTGVVALMACDQAAALTGATVVVDGGTVLVP